MILTTLVINTAIRLSGKFPDSQFITTVIQYRSFLSDTKFLGYFAAVVIRTQ